MYINKKNAEILISVICKLPNASFEISDLELLIATAYFSTKHPFFLR